MRNLRKKRLLGLFYSKLRLSLLCQELGIICATLAEVNLGDLVFKINNLSEKLVVICVACGSKFLCFKISNQHLTSKNNHFLCHSCSSKFTCFTCTGANLGVLAMNISIHLKNVCVTGSKIRCFSV